MGEILLPEEHSRRRRSTHRSARAGRAARCHGDRRVQDLRPLLRPPGLPGSEVPFLGAPGALGTARGKDKGGPPAAYLLRGLRGVRKASLVDLGFCGGRAAVRPGSYAEERGWGAGSCPSCPPGRGGGGWGVWRPTGRNCFLNPQQAQRAGSWLRCIRCFAYIIAMQQPSEVVDSVLRMS